MKVGIFGLGYVGLTTAACLLEKGHEVAGYEISGEKRDLLARGVCPLREPGVEEILVSALKAGRFVVREAVDPLEPPDILFICVGTPSAEDGSTDLRAVTGVFQELETLAAGTAAFAPEVVLRSTVMPGTLEGLGRQFPGIFGRTAVLFYPEFLREGTAMRDFHHPAQTVIGTVSAGPAPSRIFTLLGSLGFEAETVDATTAESVKLACNTFHALKICFANEIARLVSATGGDAVQAMRLFCKDTQLNISSLYLKPGTPYGGSCLPKDTRAVARLGDRLGLGLSLAKACAASNGAHFDHILRVIEGHRPETIALLGFAFKKDTDDIRESPTVELLHRLVMARGYTIRVHDFLVRPEIALGANERLMEKLAALPDFSFHTELDAALEGADVVVILHADARYQDAALPPGAVAINVAEWKNV